MNRYLKEAFLMWVPGDYLIQITNEHPYFSPAQFFLLLLTEQDTAEYKSEAAKAAVLFNNAYWLQFQLKERHWVPDHLSDILLAGNKFQSSPPHGVLAPLKNEDELIAAHETAIPDQGEKSDQLETELTGFDGNAVAKDTVPLQPGDLATGMIEDQEIEPIISEHVDLYEQGITKQAVVEDVIETVFSDSNQFKENFDDNTGEETTLVTETENIVVPGLEEEDNKSTPENEIQAVNNHSAFINEAVNGNEIIDNPPTRHFNNDNHPLINEPEPEDSGVKEPDTAPLNFKLNIDTSENKEENITFEPLHTSDYFASIGVKLSGEINPSDKLGKQLKSFTEWLKTMKKIHNGQPPPLSGQGDVSIQKLAEASNKDDAVVTEAMADVLLQQGKSEKAIEVYKKLSLLNPSKSIYFAAKIDQLKEH